MPPEVDEMFIAFKIQRGLTTEEAPHQSDSKALIQILGEFLGVSLQPGYSVSHAEGLVTIEQMESLKADLEARISELFGELSGELSSVKSRFEAFQASEVEVGMLEDSTDSAPGQLNLLGVENGTNVPEEADGERWLTTSQAFDRAKDRGCERGKNGFKGWSQRNPEECFEMYGLRRLDHTSNGHKAPGYEDVRWLR